MKEIVVAKLTARFKDSLESISEYRGELTIVVGKRVIADACMMLRDDPELQFDALRDLCGADYRHHEPPGGRYEVVYNLYSLKHKHRLRLKVRVPESDPHVPSVTAVWKGANWNEREAFDMFGIIFDGHPDLRRIYMPEEFEHHPLRKEFPLMGIPGSLPLPRK